MIERQIDVATKAGATTTFIVHPDRGGPHPLVIFYMDAPAIREELRDMARRFATSGYYVMLPNLYYRAGEMELGPINPDPNHPSRKKMFELMNGLSIDMVMDDTDAMLAFAEADPAASTAKVGLVGYCMSGQFVVNAAARHPDKVKAGASIYGTYLVTDKPNSPHVMARQAGGELYFACAEIDVWAPAEMVAALDQSLKADKINAEVEVYTAVHHGFAFPQRPAYDKASAEKHWERVLALFRRNLG